MKNGLIVPFLLVKFDCDAITNVTISPITEFGIAKESVKELLENKIGQTKRAGKQLWLAEGVTLSGISKEVVPHVDTLWRVS